MFALASFTHHVREKGCSRGAGACCARDTTTMQIQLGQRCYSDADALRLSFFILQSTALGSPFNSTAIQEPMDIFSAGYFILRLEHPRNRPCLTSAQKLCFSDHYIHTTTGDLYRFIKIPTFAPWAFLSKGSGRSCRARSKLKISHKVGVV
jgi:hypothetical protein